MKRLFYLVLILIILILVVSFALKNPQSVTITYYFDISWTGRMTTFLAVVFAVGAFLGVLLTSMWVLRSRRQLSKAKKEIRKMEQEVSNLRALPIRDQI